MASAEHMSTLRAVARRAGPSGAWHFILLGRCRAKNTIVWFSTSAACRRPTWHPVAQELLAAEWLTSLRDAQLVGIVPASQVAQSARGMLLRRRHDVQAQARHQRRDGACTRKAPHRVAH